MAVIGVATERRPSWWNKEDECKSKDKENTKYTKEQMQIMKKKWHQIVVNLKVNNVKVEWKMKDTNTIIQFSKKKKKWIFAVSIYIICHFMNKRIKTGSIIAD